MAGINKNHTNLNTVTEMDTKLKPESTKGNVTPKVNLRYQRDKDREPVKGIFRFYEVPGGSVSFNYRAYKEDEVERFDLVDGQVYTLPLGVAKHLNKNGKYPIHKFITNEQGVPIMKVGQFVRRFGFQSLEFVDIDDLTEEGGQIVTAEMTGL
jgi:hypothetical protein